VSRDDPNTRERLYGIEVLEDPPVGEWGILIGEILYNLRSGLDHLAYALSAAHTPGKTPPRGTEFPIFRDEDRFDDVKSGGRYKIRGMSWEMQCALRDLQPFNTGNPPEAQSLWLLQHMSNVDKHRTLHLAVFGAPGIAFTVDPDVEIVPVWSEDGSVIAKAVPLTAQAEVKNDPTFVPQIIVKETLPGRDWRPLVVQLQTFLRIAHEHADELSHRFLPD
jgi:hypothetical protein